MPSAGGRVRLSAGPLAALHPYAEGVSNPLRSLLEEPRPSAPPVRVWRDWALLAVVTVSGVLEGVLREDLPLPGLSVVLTVGLAPLLLWRRTHPLAVVATAFGVAAVVDIGLIVADAPALEMHSMVYFLVFPYALFRWGSGREAAAGLAIILVAATLEFFVNWTGVAIGGGAVLMSAFALGLAVRSQHGARQRRWEQVKSEERVLLARELHDTVAHHVSAIAVQAQAGRALAATSPSRPAPRPAHRTRGAGAAHHRAGSHQRRDRRRAAHQPQHGEDPHRQPHGKARRPEPGGGRDVGVRDRPGPGVEAGQLRRQEGRRRRTPPPSPAGAPSQVGTCGCGQGRGRTADLPFQVYGRAIARF